MLEAFIRTKDGYCFALIKKAVACGAIAYSAPDKAFLPFDSRRALHAGAKNYRPRLVIVVTRGKGKASVRIVHAGNEFFHGIYPHSLRMR
jgi:hypothetical protein